MLRSRLRCGSADCTTALGPHRGDESAASRVLAQLLEIEVALQATHHLVGQLAAVAEGDDGLALRVDHRPPDPAMLEQLLHGLVDGLAVGGLDVLGTVRIAVAEMVDQRLQFRRFSLSAAPRREARKRGFGLLVDMGQYRSAGVLATG